MAPTPAVVHPGGVPAESPNIAVTARGLSDYSQMFALAGDALTRRSFLNCASGASSFGAEVRSRGGHVLSADPLYGAGVDAVRQRALHNLTNCELWLGTHTDLIDWGHLGSPAAYRQAGLRSLALFAEDFVAQPDHYLAAALPGIPLSDGAVDTVVCANFLFAYADVIDAEFHVAAIIEMARVARSEVLIHPVGARDGRDIKDFTAVVTQRLSGVGLHTQTFAPAGTWLRGASTMRVAT
jgi:hypothetical protein